MNPLRGISYAAMLGLLISFYPDFGRNLVRHSTQ
jgi:hypothetical protein